MDVKTQSLGDALTEPEQAAPPAPGAAAPRSDGGWIGFIWFLAKLLLAVLAFRTLVVAPFTIPSESMLPRLMVGDYLLAAKWPYGISRHSLPFDLPLPGGRLFAQTPERGDVVIFNHPVDGTEYIKRVIGLPGDRVAIIAGRVVLNGVQLDRVRVTPVLVPMSLNTQCASGDVARMADGGAACRYAAFRETLPEGRSYTVLDLGLLPAYDNVAEKIVPEGALFVMGDNRDRSLDSRFEAEAGLGVGLVPQDLLVGRASIIVWSTDGSAEWLKPWTWFAAARWDRVGDGL